MKQTVQNRLASLDRATSSGKTLLVDVLTAAMRDRSPALRSRAIKIVAERQVEAAVPMVETLLQDNAEQVRMDALECLASFQSSSMHSREKMRRMLSDTSFFVRIQALESLTVLDDQDGLANIAQLLADKDALVRAASARSIAGLGGVFYVQAIQDGLRFEKNDSARAGFLEALYLLGKKEVFEAFLRLLLSADYRVRCAVANALEDMPLDQHEISAAIAALSHAEMSALGVADKSSIAGVLPNLRKKMAAS